MSVSLSAMRRRRGGPTVWVLRRDYDTAISNAVASGVAVAVAAGNSGVDAANYSPASCKDAFTVSALADFDGKPGGEGSPTCRDDQDDTLADFSNYGSIIDVTAPGVCILSTYPIEQGSYGTISGTSMASPHVAGALALLASSNTPSNATDVNSLYNTVVDSGNSNWTDESGDGVKEPLLDVSTFTANLRATEPTNGAPTASFTYSCTDLGCSFDGTGSSDPENDTLSYSWEFGDGATATGATTSHTYGAHGTYTVNLIVSDGSLNDTDSQSVTVSEPSTSAFKLTVNGYKVKGVQHADLAWSGTTGANVDIHRNGSVVATTANDGEHTDSTGQKGGGSATYTVCEAGTSTCSNTVTVTY